MKLSKILTPKDMDSLTDQCLRYIDSIQHQDHKYDSLDMLNMHSYTVFVTERLILDKLSRHEANNTQAILKIKEILTELNTKGDSQ